MAISQSEAMPVNTQEPQIEVAATNERFTIWKWCPEDDSPPSHYVIRIWQRQGLKARIHDHAAGPFATKDEAKAELDRILALKEQAEPDQYQLEMSRSLRGDNRADQFMVTRTWFDGVTHHVDIEAGPFLTKEEAETAFQRLTAEKNKGSSTYEAHISA